MKLTQGKLFRLSFAPDASKISVCMHYIKHINGPIGLRHPISTSYITYILDFFLHLFLNRRWFAWTLRIWHISK